MTKKHELLKTDTINISNKTLYRIKALKSFSNVTKGDLGGYVQSEDNLSHNGLCWIYDNAKVFGNARIYDNAKVYYNAWVHDNAMVFNNARIYDNARVYNNAWVYDKAIIYDNARVYDNAKILDNVIVYGHGRVYNNDIVCGNARVYSNIFGNIKKSIIIDEIQEPNKCNHEFKEYIGLTEVYQYCTKCDVKKSNK